MHRYFQTFIWFLSLVDFFGITPSSRITFKNNRIYSSCAGRTMTVIVIFSFFGSFSYFGLNMMTRSSPNTIIADEYKDTPDYLNITKDNFFLAFGLKSQNGSYDSDLSIFVPQLSIVAKNKSNVNLNNNTAVSIGLCDIDNDVPKSPQLQEYFQVNSIQGMFCIKNYQPVEMMGSEDSLYYEYIDITIRKCDPTNTTVPCKSDAEISQFINSHDFTMTFTSYAVNSLNYETPLDQHGNYYTVPANDQSKAQIYFFFQHLYVDTDQGIISKDVQSQRAMTKSDEKTYFVQIDSNLNFIEVIFAVDKVVQYYERTYDKLQQVLAQTGGALQILSIAALILTRPIIDFNFYRDLGNEYFEFEIPQKGTEKVVRKKLEISFLEYIYSFFRINDKELIARRRIWDRSKSLLNENLSLGQILNKIAELDKMKYLLFDSNQLLLFEFIPKPIITADQVQNNPLDKKKTLSFSEVRKLNESFFLKKTNWHAHEMKTAYQSLREKRAKTEIDAKILKVVEMKTLGSKLGDINIKGQENKPDGSMIKLVKFKQYAEKVREDFKENDSKEKKGFIDNSNSFRPILPRSEEDDEIIIRESPTPYIPHIDVSSILRDLDSLDTKKELNNTKKK